MFGFEDLSSEAKDRFLKDKFWSAAFITFVLCNYDVLIILASDLKYAEKIAFSKYALSDGFFHTFLIAVIIAVFRTLAWPFVAKAIRYHLLRIDEWYSRQENLLISSGAVDARNVIALISLIHQNRNHYSRIINDLRQLPLSSTDENVKSIVGVLEAYNSYTFGNLTEICEDLKISENDISILISLLNPEIKGFEKPNKKTWKDLIKKMDEIQTLKAK